MTTLEAILLGLIQGLTEFLPVSSSGHLVFAQRLMGIEGENLFFDILVHVATLIAVCTVLYKDIFRLLKKPLSMEVRLLLIATALTMAIGLAGKKFFEDSFDGRYLSWGFFATAVVLTITDLLNTPVKKGSFNNLNGYYVPPNIKNSVIMGFVQGLAILPGLSRSGSTICAGVATGMNKSDAAKFSFLMSIPVIIGGAVLTGIDAARGAGSELVIGAGPLIAGFLAAMLSGFLAVRFMLYVVKKYGFTAFAVYMCGMSIAAAVLM